MIRFLRNLYRRCCDRRTLRRRLEQVRKNEL
jgi:hypothetical protein